MGVQTDREGKTLLVESEDIEITCACYCACNVQITSIVCVELVFAQYTCNRVHA